MSDPAHATQAHSTDPSDSSSSDEQSMDVTSQTPQQDSSSDAPAAAKAATPQAAAPAAKSTTPPAAAPAAAKAPAAPPPQPSQAGAMTPYPDMESLKELYQQVPAPAASLHRFGSEIFTNGTGNAAELPSDLPVGPDYVLGPGDQVTLNMTGGHAGTLRMTVDRQGELALPEAGSIVVNGLTIGEAQARIQAMLANQFRDEHVEISLGRLRSIRVYVVGDAQRPGAYDVSSLSTPLNVFYASGGPTARGSLRILRQMRGAKLIREIDLYDFLLHGKQFSNERLESGDTLVVPPVGEQVTVAGLVNRPAIYELHGETTLKQVLELAGGLRPTASLDQVEVERVVANDKRTMISLNLPLDLVQRGLTLDGFKVQGEDVVSFAPILPYNAQAVFLEGHVYRPGKYTYHDGMTVNDLVQSYQDVLPEPADRVDLVRLVPPDLKPEIISLNLPEVLAGNERIRLQPFDLVRVYGRYEADAPKVAIRGEVLRPGSYPLSKGMTLRSLIGMAGGFTRAAFTQQIGVASYGVIDGKSVLISEQTVSVPHLDDPLLIGQAQPGDVVLHPGDVVSVRQLEGWADIGATVQISGEVEHPGAYSFQPGEQLSDVLTRAGGFRPGAYPGAAILTRVQVREVQETNRQHLIEELETMPLQTRTNLASTTDDSSAQQQSLELQRQQILAALRSHPVEGRQSIQISADISSWKGSPSDVQLRAGDVLQIPKQPQFVVVTGEVFNANAMTYVPHKNAGWYLARAGGVKQFGDKKRIFVLRADGEVVSHGSSFHSVLDYRLSPGDSVIVPAKIVAPSEFVRNLLAAGQIAGSLALTAAIGLRQ